MTQPHAQRVIIEKEILVTSIGNEIGKCLRVIIVNIYCTKSNNIEYLCNRSHNIEHTWTMSHNIEHILYYES